MFGNILQLAVSRIFFFPSMSPLLEHVQAKPPPLIACPSSLVVARAAFVPKVPGSRQLSAEKV